MFSKVMGIASQPAVINFLPIHSAISGTTLPALKPLPGWPHSVRSKPHPSQTLASAQRLISSVRFGSVRLGDDSGTVQGDW
jgi:hypothetical protein